jgi:hypothetical protein
MTDETQVVDIPNVMGMSDEEFLNQDFSEVDASVQETSIEQSEEAEAETIEEEASTSLDESGDDEGQLDEEEGTEEDSDEEVSEAADERSSDEPEETDEEETDDVDSDESTEDKDGDVENTDEPSVDTYKSQIDELFAPIKANGKEVKINDIEEARKFIRMGMGFNKKMEALKPARLLQQKMKEHGLLEEGKLDFLIALDKKTPEAIAQLLKDSKIDPLSIDMESDSSYQPETYSGGEDKLALDDVISELEQSDHISDITNLVATKWGDSSRNILRQQPGLLKIIESHMNVGIYDSIMERVEKAQMLSEYKGLSDIEVYGQVAEVMNQEGQFAHLSKAKEEEHKPAPVIKAPARKPKTDPNVKRKKATAVTKSSPTPKKPEPDYLNMSDDDFLKNM